MDVLPNEDELMVIDSARKFLADQCPPSLIRTVQKEPLKYSATLWKSVAELGWPGLCLPEEYGGQGAPLNYLGFLFEEIGRRLAPIPFHSVVAPGLVIARHGNEAQKKLLPRVANGELILTFAIQEADGDWWSDSVQTIGRREGDSIVLNGAKTFVDNFRIAAKCLVLFADASAGGKLRLALVDTKAAGVDVVDLLTTTKDGEAAITFKDVRVPVSDVINEENTGQALSDLRDYAAAFAVCQMVGAAREAAQMAIDYSKQRQAFGQLIGAFQSLQHMAADMIIGIDGAQLLAREALWRLSEGLPGSVEVSQAKSFANEKCLAACRSAQQIHGGIGFIMEFDLHLWYRYVTSWSLRCGTVGEHRRRIAAALLDTPGKVRLGGTQNLPAGLSPGGR